MSPKRGDRVAPPARPSEWEIRFLDNKVAKGWEELCSHAPGNVADAWELMRHNPLPMERTHRHHPLHGHVATGTLRGEERTRWQIEVTGGSRIWYLVDEERRTVWTDHASPRHPKATE